MIGFAAAGHERQRAALFTSLARYADSGVPIAQALQTLAAEMPGPLAGRLATMASHAARGVALAEAGRASGVLAAWEARLVLAAERTGTLASILNRLAAHYAVAARRLGTLNARLALPAAVVMLGTLVAPLPAVVRGDLSAAGYAGRMLASAALLYAAWRGLQGLWRSTPAGAARLSWLLDRVPGVGRLVRSRRERDLLYVLGTALKSGLPADEALGLAAELATGRFALGQLREARAAVARGGSMVAALRNASLIADPAALALLDTGEAAGRLDEMMEHSVAQLDDRLDQIATTWGEWLPRIAYFAAIGLFVV